MAEADFGEPEGSRDAAIHGADIEMETVAPCLEPECLADGKEEGGGIDDRADEGGNEEKKDEQAPARPAARTNGWLFVRIGYGMQR